MNTDEMDLFRRNFKSIVWKKGQLTDANNKIKQLSRWDKDGSHTSAIKKQIAERDKQKQRLESMLNGKTYDEWKEFSKKLSSLVGKNKRASEQKLRTEKELNNLTFTLSLP